jgi:hypothetical protein
VLKARAAGTGAAVEPPADHARRGVFLDLAVIGGPRQRRLLSDALPKRPAVTIGAPAASTRREQPVSPRGSPGGGWGLRG